MLLLQAAAFAQVTSTADTGPFPVAEQELSFTDAGLSSPNVTVKIWYPGQSAGNNMPVATGQFPTVAFGHGFNLNYLDYAQLCGHLASWGYVVMSPDVQNGFSVSHEEFARELAACLNYMQAEGANAASDFYQHVDTMTGVLGHSMGGGASGLVPSVFPSIDAVSGLAAAETNPSAIAALANYAGPYQIISGSADNTAPESSNQIPMYNAATGQKQWVSITGGAHCKFTDGNTICDLVSSAGSVTRTFQIYLAKKYSTAFFNYNLKADNDALPFLCGDSLLADQNRGFLTSQQTFACNVGFADAPAPQNCWTIGPNPIQEKVQLTGEGNYAIYNAVGALIFEGNSDKEIVLDFSGFPAGIYFLKLANKSCSRVLVKE